MPETFVLLFHSRNDPQELWVPALEKTLPHLEIRVWPDIGKTEHVTYALVWKPPAGLLASLPNLKAIFSLGAGVDHLLSDPSLPQGIPLIRMVEDGLTSGMSEYIVLTVLAHHRDLYHYLDSQKSKVWKPKLSPPAWQRRVGIMGLGILGCDAALKLSNLGFDVAGWSRSFKNIAGIKQFIGTDQLSAFLQRTDILICLLPLTPQTQGILNRKLFEQLPKGAFLINAGRGGHLIEEDLLWALEHGLIKSATLDVFREEPLPKSHPFWVHPNIIITPHVASLTNPETASQSLAENITRIEKGLPPLFTVDRQQGY